MNNADGQHLPPKSYLSPPSYPHACNHRLQSRRSDDPLTQIEAETLPDISESFDIEAVPSFLLLRVSPAVRACVFAFPCCTSCFAFIPPMKASPPYLISSVSFAAPCILP